MGKNKQTKKFRLPSKEASRLLSYWKRSLLEGERESISSQVIRDMSMKVSIEDFQRAHCSPEVHRTLVSRIVQASQHRKQNPKRTAEQASLSEQSLAVLVCSMQFRRKSTEASGPSHLEILWYPALLHPSGELDLPEEKTPWISREVLEPIATQDCPTIGTLKTLEKLYQKRIPEKWNSWKKYIQFGEQLITSVSGRKAHRLDIPGYTRLDHALVVPDQSNSGGNESLLRLLEEVSAGETPLNALTSLLTLKNSSPSPFRSDKSILAKSAKRHLGHFSDSFSIAGSQRLAVHRFLELGDNQILSVTGPPGTGKTTVLQSVIASLWVESALATNARPPIIACTGATNQSVMNIIDSFERSAGSEDPFSGRWLPHIHSFGTFCVSQMKAEEVPHYQLAMRDGSGLSSQMETPEYIQSAEKYFIHRATNVFGGGLTVKKVVQKLHQELRTQHRTFVRSLDALSGIGFLTFLLSLLQNKKQISYQEFFASLSDYDVGARNNMFKLATHYWEGRWLLEASSRTQNTENRQRRLDVGRTAWERRAMITPAFVGTLAMIPRFFPLSHREPEVPSVDVLICDEAGQIPTELGAPCLMLARKALIVGDCQQLEPFWTVQPHVDRANLIAERLLSARDEEGWARLSERGILASNGSLMKLALNSARHSEAGQRGILLSDQRRSVPELVEFSNTLAYEGKLRAKRRELSQRVLPAFGYVHVPGRMQSNGTSRENRIEARELIQWLLEREESLKSFYQANSLVDVVAIISPFAAQHREIRRLLPERWQKMIVGTVGGLQGAERPVILFSAVYDGSYEETYFFDRGPNMLNVAVSRARDSFIVFANTTIFDSEALIPSGILSRFLFARAENELPLAVESHKSNGGVKMEQKSTSRIATLDGHTKILRDVLRNAAQSVVIVSPTISSHAIRKDEICPEIEDAVRRGIQVEIYADYDLNRSDGDFKPTAKEGFELLRTTGATLHIVARIHSKILMADENFFVEGSFNWLSANRQYNSRYQKYEGSNVFTESEAFPRIVEVRRDLAYHLKAVDDLYFEDASEFTEDL